MLRYLFIVARDRSDVYAELQRQSLGNPEVEIIVDRRLSERRQHHDSRSPERRSSERRGQRGGSSRVRGIGGDPGLPALIVELEPGAAPPADAG